MMGVKSFFRRVLDAHEPRDEAGRAAGPRHPLALRAETPPPPFGADDGGIAEAFYEAAAPSASSYDAVELAAVNACSSTTQTLRSLADWQRRHGDEDGGALLEQMARDFARHEVCTT